MSRHDVTPDGTAEPSRDASQPMSAAERARRYRQRKRKAKAADRLARGDLAAEPAAADTPRARVWDRAVPFPESNSLSVVHGATSGRYVDPLGVSIVEDLLAQEDCPAHLRLARYRPALEAWGRAEAAVRLLGAWLASQDVEAALTETTRIEETSEHDHGSGYRQSVARRVEGALSALDRHERTAARLRDSLGLTPASAARMRLDAVPKDDLAQDIAELPTDDGGGVDGLAY